MATTTVSIKEFEQDASRVRMASAQGPVFITERGRPANVLLTIEEYRKLGGREPNGKKTTGKGPTILELLAMPGVGEIEFEPPRLTGNSLRPADFTE